MTEITLVSNGQRWRGMKSVTIRKSMDRVHHSFSLTTTDRFQEGLARWNVAGGAAVELFLNQDRLFSGFVNTYDVEIGESAHDIAITGESAAIDLVECGHQDPYFWKNTTYEEIIRQVLAPYSLTPRFSKELKPLPITGHRVAVNATAFQIVKTIAELNGLTVFTAGDGQIAFTDGTDATGGTVLGRGDYVSLSTAHQISGGHSLMRIKSQRNDFGGDPKIQQSEKVVRNSTVTRYRPLVVIHTGDEDEFADYANHRFAGASKAAKIVVKSAYDKQGRLWDINQKVHLDEPLADVKDDLLIADYQLTVDESAGLAVTLGLRMPQTYAPGNSDTLFARRARRRSGGFFGDVLRGLTG